jgi:hypothetical protein
MGLKNILNFDFIHIQLELSLFEIKDFIVVVLYI